MKAFKNPPGEIIARWIFNSTAPGLQGYVIQVKALRPDAMGTTAPVPDIYIADMMVGFLVPFTVYEVQVVAVLNDMTVEAAPSEAPSGLVATPIGASELQLVWKVRWLGLYAMPRAAIFLFK